MPYTKPKDDVPLSECAELAVADYMAGTGKHVGNPLAFRIKMVDMQAELIRCHMASGFMKKEDMARARKTLRWLERGGTEVCGFLCGEKAA